MVLPASGSISMSSIASEFGLSGQVSLSDLRGVGVENLTPSSGPISFSDFHSKERSRLNVDLRAYPDPVDSDEWVDEKNNLVFTTSVFNLNHYTDSQGIKYWSFDGYEKQFRNEDIPEFHSGNITIEVWYNPSLFIATDGDTTQALVNIGSSALVADINMITVHPSGYYGRAQVRVGGNGGVQASQMLYRGNWYHIVGTYEVASSTSRPTKIYINGQLRGTSDYGTDVNSIETSSDTFPVSIGNYYANSNSTRNSFQANGKIGTCRIYDGCLTQQQVYNNWNRTRSYYAQGAPSSAPIYGY